MISSLQRISWRVQQGLSVKCLDKVFLLLNLPYIYSYIFKIFSYKQLIFLFQCILQRKLVITSQNGFGDIFQALLVCNYFKDKGWDTNLAIIHKTEDSTVLNMSKPNNPKELLYGDYLQDFIHHYRDRIKYLGKSPIGELPSLYCHIPFFRGIIGYKQLFNQGTKIFARNNQKSREGISFYFRNNIESISELFEVIFQETSETIYLFGENIPQNYLLINNPRIHKTSELSFNEKIKIYTNSKLVITGRGGFALLPLYNKTNVISFFDDQGMKEIEFGLWSQELWSNCTINKPLTDKDLAFCVNFLRENYVE